jgi:acid phosphatase family membrane protein YuiD
MLFSSGGMPSSHSATVGALCTSSAIAYGFGSFEFAVSAVIAMVVITDAMGVRWETGEQSKVINKIVKNKMYMDNIKGNVGGNSE